MEQQSFDILRHQITTQQMENAHLRNELLSLKASTFATSNSQANQISRFNLDKQKSQQTIVELEDTLRQCRQQMHSLEIAKECAVSQLATLQIKYNMSNQSKHLNQTIESSMQTDAQIENDVNNSTKQDKRISLLYAQMATLVTSKQDLAAANAALQLRLAQQESQLEQFRRQLNDAWQERDHSAALLQELQNQNYSQNQLLKSTNTKSKESTISQSNSNQNNSIYKPKFITSSKINNVQQSQSQADKLKHASSNTTTTQISIAKNGFVSQDRAVKSLISLKSANKELSQANADLKKEVERTLQAMQKMKGDHEQGLNDVKMEVVVQRKRALQLENAMNMNTDLQIQSGLFEARLRQVTEEKDLLLMEIDELKLKLNATNATHEQQILQMRSNNMSLQKQNEDLQKQTVQLQTQNEETVQKHALGETKAAVLLEQVSQFKSQIIELKKQIVDLKRSQWELVRSRCTVGPTQEMFRRDTASVMHNAIRTATAAFNKLNQNQNLSQDMAKITIHKGNNQNQFQQYQQQQIIPSYANFEDVVVDNKNCSKIYLSPYSNDKQQFQMEQTLDQIYKNEKEQEDEQGNALLYHNLLKLKQAYRNNYVPENITNSLASFK